MKLEKLIEMYTGASVNPMKLELANCEKVETTIKSYIRYNAEGDVLEEKERNDKKDIYPWLKLLRNYGDREISDFSTVNNEIIFWEKGAL